MDLAIQNLKITFVNMFKDVKENMILISEQIRNLSREIKAVKRNGNSKMKHLNPEIKKKLLNG